MELQVVLESECLRTELALKWILALFEIELGSVNIYLENFIPVSFLVGVKSTWR